MSQRAKVANQEQKILERKKTLGQAHNVYQKYIIKIKKVRTNMELYNRISNEILAMVNSNWCNNNNTFN